MFALGQKQTCAAQPSCPLYPRKRTCAVQLGDVRFVPIADIASFDHFVGTGKH